MEQCRKQPSEMDEIVIAAIKTENIIFLTALTPLTYD